MSIVIHMEPVFNVGCGYIDALPGLVFVLSHTLIYLEICKSKSGLRTKNDNLKIKTIAVEMIEIIYEWNDIGKKRQNI